LGLLTYKNRLPYNLGYTVGGDVKYCSINQSVHGSLQQHGLALAQFKFNLVINSLFKDVVSSCISKDTKITLLIHMGFAYVLHLISQCCVFFKVRGFSNNFWGWGREDDEFYRRIKDHDLQVRVIFGTLFV